MRWLGDRDQRGVDQLRNLLAGGPAVLSLPLLPASPADLTRLEALGRKLEDAWIQ
jgi:hypothetical protein